MIKQTKLFINQYGDRYYAKTVKELKEKVGSGKVFKIYCDKKDGSVVQTGYGIGRQWFDMFIPFEILQK